MIEYKSILGEVKDVDVKSRVITGYLSSFGNVDDHGDIVEKGAFSKTIVERGKNIFFLNQHDWKQPHGKFALLKEDDFGLYFESEPLIDTSYSSDVLKLYEAGIVKEHSIGYQTILSDFDHKNEVRHLKELKLYEGSNVTLGANSNTPFLGFKSKTIKEIDEEQKKIIKAIRTGTFTDDTFLLLELALKQLQTEAYNLGRKSLEEPPKSTQNEPIEDEILNTIKNFKNSLR